MNKGKRIIGVVLCFSLLLSLLCSCDLDENTESKLLPTYKSSPTASDASQEEESVQSKEESQEESSEPSSEQSKPESSEPMIPQGVGDDVTDNLSGEIIYIDGVGYDILSVVNKNYILPEDCKEPNLVVLPDSTTDREDKTYKVDARVAEPLAAFLKAARAEGYKPIVYSAYRSYTEQKNLYERRIKEYLDANPGAVREDAVKAITQTAPTGTSEHCTGFAIDIYCWSAYNEFGKLHRDFDKYDLCKWMHANAHKYGFILRYPEGKEDITMISYESWHFRYVGVEAATEIYNNGLCLEEYTGKLG